MCPECPLRRTCEVICTYLELELPSLQAGRLDPEDVERIYQGRVMTHALLDNVNMLSTRQREVVQLYFRENRQQVEIAEMLHITQQAVGDALTRARETIGKRLKSYYTFFSPDSASVSGE